MIELATEFLSNALARAEALVREMEGSTVTSDGFKFWASWRAISW